MRRLDGVVHEDAADAVTHDRCMRKAGEHRDMPIGA
jgi:hypothetical protein